MNADISGYLMLGWEINQREAANYKGCLVLSEEAEKRVGETLGKPWLELFEASPIIDHGYDYVADSIYLANTMHIGVVLMSDWDSMFDVKSYGEFLSANADLLTNTAKELYRAIMGKEPDEEPNLMIVVSES